MKYLSFVVSSLVVAVLVSSRAAVSLPAEALEQDSEAPSSEATGNSLYADLQQTVSRSVCPDDMVLVDGQYCPKVEEICLFYVDIHGNQIPPGDMPQQTGRCGEFKYPTRCLVPTVHKRFCIDSYEIPNVKGEIPTSWLTYTDAQNFCKSKNKRLATSSEWEFSCEGGGESPQPYPYGSGYVRDSSACNTDNPVPKGIDVFKATSHNTEMAKKLDAMLVPSGSMPTCVSPFGLYDQVGNLDEYVTNETGEGYISGLKGGHIWGVRSRCRPMTTAHNGVAPPKGSGFAWYETSGRCAKDAN